MRPNKVITVICVLFFLFLAGCSDSLRFAPSEAQKQTAERTYLLAEKIDEAGAAPDTADTRDLVAGTQAALAYIGRPKIPANPNSPPEQVRAVTAQAATDAAKRPVIGDVFTATEQGLSLATQLAILFGVGGAGFGGKKVLDWLAIAKQKSEALEQIVKGGEKFKQLLAASPQTDPVAAFSQAQSSTQTSATKVIVTELKS